jgi:hypothetical protein
MSKDLVESARTRAFDSEEAGKPVFEARAELNAILSPMVAHSQRGAVEDNDMLVLTLADTPGQASPHALLGRPDADPSPYPPF